MNMTSKSKKIAEQNTLNNGKCNVKHFELWGGGQRWWWVQRMNTIRKELCQTLEEIQLLRRRKQQTADRRYALIASCWRLSSQDIFRRVILSSLHNCRGFICRLLVIYHQRNLSRRPQKSFSGASGDSVSGCETSSQSTTRVSTYIVYVQCAQ